MGLLRPRSHCPACEHAIRPSDNIPVLGWVKLKGRCRHCGARISPRYPLVEAAVGILFVTLAWAELLSGAVNLPARTYRESLLSGIAFGEEARLFTTLLYHGCALCILLAVALLEWDGRDPPARLVWPALAIGLACPLVLPALRPVPLAPGGLSSIGWLSGLGDGVAGWAVGWLAGALVGAGAASGAVGDSARKSMPSALSVVGVFLGWQAAIGIACIAAVACLGMRLLALRRPVLARLPATSLVFVAAVAQVLFWRPAAALAWWPGPRSGLGTLALALGGLLILTLATRGRQSAPGPG